MESIQRKTLDFRYSPFKEDIGIFGKKGEGKTSRCRVILDTIPNIARWIWSPQRPLDNYQGYGVPVTKIEDLKHGAFIWNGIYNKETFIQFISRAFHYMRNLVIVIDDCHEYVSKQFIPTEFETYILSGRNRGLSSIFISPMPSKTHNAILAQCSHIFAYKFTLQTQIEWLRDNFFGNEAWLLLPKDLRNKFYTDSNSIDQLPKFSYLYRKDTDSKTQIMIPNQGNLATSLNEEKTQEKPNESRDPASETQDNSLSRKEL